MIRQMTAPHQSTTEPAEPATEGQTSTLFRVAAGVAIAAGLVFMAALIFFSGVMVGKAASGYGDDGRFIGPMGHGARPGTCPMMKDDHGMMPGGMMPGGMPRPTPTPSPTAPGVARP